VILNTGIISSIPKRKKKTTNQTGVSDSIVIPIPENESSIPVKKEATVTVLSEKQNTDKNKKEEQDKKKEEGQEDNEDKLALQEDVYSLMFTEGFGMVWLLSFSVVLMQLFIVLLFYKDLLQDGSDGNRLNIPINVGNQITIAQFLAVPLAIMSHGDCTKAIFLLSCKYDSKI
jgi:hypothetical protein